MSLVKKQVFSSFEHLLAEGRVWVADGGAARPSEGAPAREKSSVSIFSVPAIDSLFPKGGLSCGDIHEFLSEDVFSEKAKRRWHPSLIFASILLRSFLLEQNDLSLVWVGRRCFPTPHLLKLLFADAPDWKKRSFFLHTKEKEKRLWTLTQLLQASAPLGIVADGSGLSLLQMRCLQHALEKNKNRGGIFFLLLRPAWEQEVASTAQTRWLISPQISVNQELRYSLELLRAKGRHLPLKWPADPVWTLEVNYEKNNFGFREISRDEVSRVEPYSAGEGSASSPSCQGTVPLLSRVGV